VINLSLFSSFPHSKIIGDAVVILLHSGRRLTIGNILDVLEHKKDAFHDDTPEELKETIRYLRSKSGVTGG